jgi:hypothetical protein
MSNAKMQKADYPEERPDWMMIEEYAKKKSEFGCILCDKTHSRRTCEHKAKRTAKAWYEEERRQYSIYGGD